MKTYISLEDVEAKWPDKMEIPYRKCETGEEARKLAEEVNIVGAYNRGIDLSFHAFSYAERVRVLTREELQGLIFEAYPQCHDLKRQWDLADRILSAMKEGE